METFAIEKSFNLFKALAMACREKQEGTAWQAGSPLAHVANALDEILGRIQHRWRLLRTLQSLRQRRWAEMVAPESVRSQIGG